MKPLNFIYLFLISLGACWTASCASSEDHDGVQTYTIDYPACKVENRDMKEFWSSFPDTKKISLKVTDKTTALVTAAFVKLEKEHLYVLDEAMRKLVKYDLSGNPVQVLNKRGRGYGEYMDLADFCIDKEENLYIVDGQRDVINKYSRDFEYLATYDLDADIDLVQILDNGNFLLGLSSWNNRSHAGDELIITDGNFNKIKTVARYGRNIDDNYWLDSPRFIKNGDMIIYHRTIDDNATLLSSADGALKGIVKFDFGSRTIPETDRLNLEGKIENQEFKGKTTLKNCFIFANNKLCGTLYDDQEKKQFYMDCDAEKVIIFTNDKDATASVPTFCGAGEGYLLVRDLELLPESEDEAYVIYLHRIL